MSSIEATLQDAADGVTDDVIFSYGSADLDIKEDAMNMYDNYAGFSDTLDNMKDVQNDIDDYSTNTDDERKRKIKEGQLLTASTLRFESFNEALKAIFIALLVCLVILVILASGVIDITITVVAIVITLTVSIIYAGGVLVMGVNQSDILPGVFNWDFNLVE